MSEIRPVYQLQYVTGYIDITEEQYFRESYMRGTPRRILYPAAALEALQNNLDYMKNCADELLSENNNILCENEILKAESAAQAKRIAEIEAGCNPYERVDLQGKLYITGLQNKIAHQQFLIDSLMIEYCPDEMTEEQWENWKANQRKVEL